MLKLTKKERNDIFQMVEHKGLNAQNFTWETHVSKFVTVYEEQYYQALSGHRPESAEALTTIYDGRTFSFTFERDSNGIFYSSVEPHINVGHGVRSQTWTGLLNAFNEWLEVIRYELKEPDLWNSLPRDSLVATLPTTFSSEERFRPDEVAALRSSLKQIKDFIIESNHLDSPSVARIETTFVYLREKAETTTKLDWKNIFAGAIVSIILTFAVDNAPAIISLCNKLLAPMFQRLLA